MNFSVGIDWLQGIIIFESSEKLKEIATFLAELTQDEIPWVDEHPWFCGVRWNHSVSSIRGMKISWNLTNRGIKCLLVLPGSFWGKLEGIAGYWNVCRFLAELNFRCTRIDIKIDDYTKSITYEDLSDAIAKDNYSGAEVADIKRPKRRFLGYDGWTIYFGSAKSDKRVKFYDKAKESNGEIDAIRMETQYRDERANWVFSEFVECEDFAAGNFLASICIGGIVFCDIASADRQDKRKLLPWWERFTQGIARGPESTIQ